MESRIYPVTILQSLGSQASIAPGDVVRLVPEPANPVDPNAIQVVSRDGVPVGYVSNSTDTAIHHTISATWICNRLSSGSVAAVSALLMEKDTVLCQGYTMTRYLAHLFFVPVRRETARKGRELDLTVSVGSLTFRGRSRFLSDLRQHGEVRICLKKVDPAPEYGGRRLIFFLSDACAPDTACGYLDEQHPVFSEAEDFFRKNPNAVLTGITTGAVEHVSQAGSKVRLRTVPARLQFSESTGGGEYDQEVDGAIARCAGQLADIEDRLAVLQRNGTSPAIIRRTLAAMRPCRGLKRPERPFTDGEGTLNDLLAYVLRGMNITLMGEKGTGKNTLIETYAWLSNTPIVRVQGSEQMDKYDLLCSTQLANGETFIRPSEVVMGLHRGYIIVIDEANMVPPSVLSLLHSATDGARNVFVPGVGSIPVDPAATLFYTLNEGYAGTMDMNEATVDRTTPFVLRPQKDLHPVLEKYPQELVTICQKVSDEIRKAVDEGTLPSRAISIRGYIDACEVAEDIGIRRALILSVANKLPDPSWREATEGIIELNCP